MGSGRGPLGSQNSTGLAQFRNFFLGVAKLAKDFLGVLSVQRGHSAVRVLGGGTESGGGSCLVVLTRGGVREVQDALIMRELGILEEFIEVEDRAGRDIFRDEALQ